jgi:transcriptional regulator with XRE-family HTH domain
MNRKKINMTQLSKETGVGLATLSDWKAGRNSPTVKNLEKLADYFGVTEAYFLKED